MQQFVKLKSQALSQSGRKPFLTSERKFDQKVAQIKKFMIKDQQFQNQKLHRFLKQGLNSAEKYKKLTFNSIQLRAKSLGNVAKTAHPS